MTCMHGKVKEGLGRFITNFSVMLREGSFLLVGPRRCLLVEDHVSVHDKIKKKLWEGECEVVCSEVNIQSASSVEQNHRNL